MNVAADARPARSARVDWLYTIGGLWIIAGIYCDLWWHLRNDVDSFLTWAHAALYAGLFFTFAVTVAIILKNRHQGYSWRRALPTGYEYTLPGIALFFLGGTADGISHTIYGFEENFNALLAPTHQLIGIAFVMLNVGPIRSALKAGPLPATLREQLPAILSLGAIVGLIRWGINPFFEPYSEATYGLVQAGFTPDVLNVQVVRLMMREHGLASALIASLFAAGTALFLVRALHVRRWGIMIALLLANGLIGIAMSANLAQALLPIASCVVAGIAADFALSNPRIPDTARSYVLGWLTPFAFETTLIVGLTIVGGTWWDPIFFSGTLLYSGVCGLLVATIVGRVRT